MGHISASVGAARKGASLRRANVGHYGVSILDHRRTQQSTPMADDAIHPQGCNIDRPLVHAFPYSLARIEEKLGMKEERFASKI